MSKNPKKIAEDLGKQLRESDRKGKLKRDGEKIAAAINKLREEKRLTRRELDRRATI